MTTNRPALAAWEAAGKPYRGPLEAAMRSERRAYNAWLESPDGRKAEAARKAAEKAAMDASVEARLAAARAAIAAEDAATTPAQRAALAQWNRAQEWPRCGDRWPMTAGERDADALLKAAKAGPYA